MRTLPSCLHTYIHIFSVLFIIYPFTAPTDNPLRKNLCPQRNTMNTGTTARQHAAIVRLYWVTSEPTNWFNAKGIVHFF